MASLEAAVMLGWIRPSVQPMSALPWLYILSGIFAGVQLVVQIAWMDSAADLFEASTDLQYALAWVALQLVALVIISAHIYKSRREFDLFGCVLQSF